MVKKKCIFFSKRNNNGGNDEECRFSVVMNNFSSKKWPKKSPESKIIGEKGSSYWWLLGQFSKLK